MNEPRKLALVFLIIMVIGLVALAIEWLRLRINGWIALLIVSLILLALGFAILPARAHDHGHPEQDAWYRTLTMPDAPQVSCCGEADAYWADEIHVKDGKTFATITDDRDDGPLMRPHIDMGTEIEVPDKKLKWDRGNPTGHSVIFVRRGHDGEHYVYCFVQGTLI